MSEEQKIGRRQRAGARRRVEKNKTVFGGSSQNATPSSVKRKTEAGLPASLQAHIGRQLRAMFDEIAREPVPDRFLQLLKDLERNEKD